MEQRQSLAQKVRDLRQSRGLSIRQLEAYMEVPHGTIFHVEAGRRRMSLRVLNKFCDALHVTAEEILSYYPEKLKSSAKKLPETGDKMPHINFSGQ